MALSPFLGESLAGAGASSSGRLKERLVRCELASPAAHHMRRAPVAQPSLAQPANRPPVSTASRRGTAAAALCVWPQKRAGA